MLLHFFIPRFLDVEHSQPNKSVKTSLGKEQLHASSETPKPKQLALDDSDLS